MRKAILMFALMALFATVNTVVAAIPTCGDNCGW
jgi:hypothetical protein